MNPEDLRLELQDADPQRRLLALKKILDRNDRGLADLVVPLLGTEKVQKIRVALIHVVGRLGGPQHPKHLLPLLADGEPEIRLKTLSALKDIADPTAYPAIVRALVLDESRDVRAYAAKILVNLGKGELMGLLRKMLRADDRATRHLVIVALGLFNNPGVVPILKLSYLQETGELKATALESLRRLGEFGNEEAKEAVYEFTEAYKGDDPTSSDLSTNDLDSDSLSFSGMEASYTEADLSVLKERASPFDPSARGAGKSAASTATPRVSSAEIPAALPSKPSGALGAIPAATLRPGLAESGDRMRLPERGLRPAAKEDPEGARAGGGASAAAPGKKDFSGGGSSRSAFPAPYHPTTTTDATVDSGDMRNPLAPPEGASGGRVALSAAGKGSSLPGLTARSRPTKPVKGPQPRCGSCGAFITHAGAACEECQAESPTPLRFRPGEESGEPRPVFMMLILVLDCLLALLYLGQGAERTLPGADAGIAQTPLFLVPAGLYILASGITTFLGFRAAWFNHVACSILVPLVTFQVLEWFLNLLILAMLALPKVRDYCAR